MSITCRPDITFAIGKTSRGMHQPTPAHVAALKHLISYMWRTRGFKFRYLSTGCNVRSHLRGISSQDASISLYAGSDGQLVDPAVGFADANFAHVSDEQRKSISGYCFFMYFCLICWRSKLLGDVQPSKQIQRLGELRDGGRARRGARRRAAARRCACGGGRCRRR